MEMKLLLMSALLGVPLLGAVIAGLARGRATQGVAVAASLVTALLGVELVLVAHGSRVSFTLGGLPWLPGPAGAGLFGLAVDALSSIMLLVITVIGFLVVLYSTEYLGPRNAEHPVTEGYQRYYFWLLVFLGSMVGVALSPNLLQLFVFWEMTTLCSWALISHSQEPASVRAGFKALVITHIGGFAFLFALLMLFAFTRSFEFRALGSLGGGMKAGAFALLLVAAWAKSAQLPFHTWLPDAMEAPTPVSAYLHAAAMVKAGVYLLARVVGAGWTVPHELGLLIAVMAVATMFMAVLAYFRQDDLKKLLAYSTIVHLGYVFVGISLGVFGSTIGYRGAALHILCHGAAKATLFLCVGSIAYGAGTRRISQLSGLARIMPLEATAFFIGALAAAGVPPLACFWSKFLIFAGALESPGGIVLLALLATETVISFSWLLWVAQKVFLGRPSVAVASAADPPWAMGFALVAGIVLCVAAPYIGLPLVNLLTPGGG
ncbi:MAG: hydrogenase 4 subunit D [Armatimonadota bacterium]